MFRRKRRRSAFSRPPARAPRYALLALGAAAALAGFAYLIRQADVLAPSPAEISVDASALLKE